MNIKQSIKGLCYIFITNYSSPIKMNRLMVVYTHLLIHCKSTTIHVGWQSHWQEVKEDTVLTNYLYHYLRRVVWKILDQRNQIHIQLVSCMLFLQRVHLYKSQDVQGPWWSLGAKFLAFLSKKEAVFTKICKVQWHSSFGNIDDA